jgi:putative DNA primase/helicase
VFYSSGDGEARPVCSPLEILARNRDANGHNWGLLVEFDDPDGTKKHWNTPTRNMAGDVGKDVLGPWWTWGYVWREVVPAAMLAMTCRVI